ncbi:hypothetical protein P7K49_009670, partial [Saguinus oedipus]
GAGVAHRVPARPDTRPDSSRLESTSRPDVRSPLLPLAPSVPSPTRSEGENKL